MTLPGQELQLPPVFAHNMVLQQGAENVIWGKAAPATRVWCRYRRTSDEAKARKNGFWSLTLDLRKTDYQESAGPDQRVLAIGIGEAGENTVFVLTNVVVGTVWVLTGWEGCGMPAEPAQQIWTYQDRVRFLTVSDFRELRQSTFPVAIDWELYPKTRADFCRHSTLAINLAHSLGAKPGYFGIVLTTAASLRATFDIPSPPDPPGLELGRDWWELANEAVLKAERDRTQQLVEAKRNREVVSLPERPPYPPSDWVRILSRESLAPKEKGTEPFLNFIGAVFPQPRPSASAPH